MVTINDLQKLIESELVLGSKLLALLDEKKSVIIKDDLERIDALTKEENETLHDIEECGYDRQEMILSITKKPPFRITEKLSDLIPQLREETKESLMLVETRKALLNLYKKIADASRLNGELLAQSISITQQMFSRLSSVDRRIKNPNYFRHGKKQASSYRAPSLNTQG